MGFQRARKEEQRERRRQEILDAAWELFEEGGLEMVTFSTIGAKVSFTRQTIYTYYRSRDEVLLDLLSRRMEDFYQDIRAMFPIGKPVTQREFCERLVDHLLFHKKMLALFSLHITLENKARYENILLLQAHDVRGVPGLLHDPARPVLRGVGGRVLLLLPDHHGLHQQHPPNDRSDATAEEGPAGGIWRHGHPDRPGADPLIADAHDRLIPLSRRWG